MIVRASADPDEIPPTMTSDSNMIRKVRLNVPFAGLMFNAFGSIVEIPQGDDLSVAREGQYGGAHTERLVVTEASPSRMHGRERFEPRRARTTN
jgi:hypothetical protein